MNYEFYIMLAVAAVGAGMWLYRKGKRIVALVRKVRRTFAGIRLNPASALDEAQCRKIAVGAMYALQQGAYQNSMETGVKDALPEILGEWWGIGNTEEAKCELDYLCRKGFRYYFPFVWQAFSLDDPERREEIFQRNMTSQEEYDKVTAQFRNLQETYGELLACGVVAAKEDLQRYGVTGWDAGRIGFLARACCEMGYITETEAWEYIGTACGLARAAFGSWKEFAMSYLIGRSLWGGKRAYNSAMKEAADKLLSDPKSPWVRYAW